MCTYQRKQAPIEIFEEIIQKYIHVYSDVLCSTGPKQKMVLLESSLQRYI